MQIVILGISSVLLFMFYILMSFVIFAGHRKWFPDMSVHIRAWLLAWASLSIIGLPFILGFVGMTVGISQTTMVIVGSAFGVIVYVTHLFAFDDFHGIKLPLFITYKKDVAIDAPYRLMPYDLQKYTLLNRFLCWLYRRSWGRLLFIKSTPLLEQGGEE